MKVKRALKIMLSDCVRLSRAIKSLKPYIKEFFIIMGIVGSLIAIFGMPIWIFYALHFAGLVKPNLIAYVVTFIACFVWWWFLYSCLRAEEEDP